MNKVPGPPGLQESSSTDGNAGVVRLQAVPPSTGFVCACGRQFPTKRGLSMHRRHCQPVDYNLERVAAIPTKRLKWSQEEDEALRRHADQMWKMGMLKEELYKLLLPCFPGRSQESIKKRLQNIKWVQPADPAPTYHQAHEVETETEPIGPKLPAPPPATATGSDPADDWRSTLLEGAVRNLRETKMGADELTNIAQKLRSGVISPMRGMDLLQDHAQRWFPHTWKPSKSRPIDCNRKWSKRAIRRANYAKIQKLYKLRKRDAASSVFSGQWKHAYCGSPPQPPEMEKYWSSVFNTPSAIDNKGAATPAAVHWSLLFRITESEVTAALKSMTLSAPGLDRITAADLLTWHQPSLAAYYNLLLAAGGPPEHLSCSRVTFIPKTDDPKTPGDYRPISIASTILRAFHKILAWRFRDTLQFSPFQHGFLQQDGCLEATTLLHTIFRRVHTEREPCAMIFLDIAKAFDTVSHNTLFRVAETAGVPLPMVAYLRHLYGCSTVKLAGKNTTCGRGVRQGDPLSPLLFIMVVEDIVSGALPEVGYDLDGQKIGCLAYADDMVLFAQKSPRLQEKLNLLSKALAGAGMALNPKKSLGLTIATDGKQKCVALLPTTYQCEGGDINPLGPGDSFRYLGLQFNWKGRIVPKHTGKLDSLLQELTRAPLKPQQRMLLLRTFLVPKFTHELVLGHAHRNTLRKLDCLVRAAVRHWLRLPKDTPLGYLHASVKDGGLGVPCFSSSIPLLQAARMEKIASNPTTTFQIVQRQDAFNLLRRRLNKSCRVRETAVTSKTEAREEWKTALLTSVDGRELGVPRIDAASHDWVSRPSRVFPRLYLRGIQLRGGVLPTRARSMRGANRTITDKTCRGACRAPETINHVLQVCEVTHDARCARHNRVMRRLDQLLRRKGLCPSIEPIVPSGSSFIKPDLLVEAMNHLWVMDVSIVSGYRMKETWEIKVSKYGQANRVTDIHRWAGVSGSVSVKHLPVIISNRGLLYEPTGAGLRSLGLSRRDCSDIALLTVAGSLKCYDAYTRGTGKGGT